MMVGNSLQSDVVPALRAGAWGVHVPAAYQLGRSTTTTSPPTNRGSGGSRALRLSGRWLRRSGDADRDPKARSRGRGRSGAASPAGVFDEPVRPDLAKRFLATPNYRILVALDGDLVVGMCTGFTHFHPDKDEEFFVNELGVGDAYRRQGIGERLLRADARRGESDGLSRCMARHRARQRTAPSPSTAR